MRMQVKHPPMEGLLCWGEDSGPAQPNHSPSVLQGSPSSALFLLPAAKAASVSWAVPGEGETATLQAAPGTRTKDRSGGLSVPWR